MKPLYDANDEALEIMLHLVDQIHFLQAQLKVQNDGRGQ
jgi:hypothetical protein